MRRTKYSSETRNRITTSAISAAAAAMPLICHVPMASAQTIYTDRAAWENAVSMTLMVEDFESEPGSNSYSTFDFPYLTFNGLHMDKVNADINTAQQFIPNGDASGGTSTTIHIRDFTAGIRFTNTNGGTNAAFGFDYYLGNQETWDVSFLDGDGNIVRYTLPMGQEPKFFGVIGSQTADLSEFTLIGDLHFGGQGGIDIDNVTFAVPAPGSAALLGVGAVLACGRRRRAHA